MQDEKVAYNRVLCIIILSIWSWSLLQFTLVLTNKPKNNKVKLKVKKQGCGHTTRKVCCSVDVWSILINIILQDAPFFTFRLLLILHYKIISYMNIFFTCKNTLVIILQFYRLIVVQAEKHKDLRTSKGDATSKNAAGNALRKRPIESAQGRASAQNRNALVKNSRATPSAKKVKSPRRAVGKLVRTASVEDDGTGIYPSPAHSAAFLLHTENDPSWRQYTRVTHHLSPSQSSPPQ